MAYPRRLPLPSSSDRLRVISCAEDAAEELVASVREAGHLDPCPAPPQILRFTRGILVEPVKIEEAGQ
jgi:hypothetical protein